MHIPKVAAGVAAAVAVVAGTTVVLIASKDDPQPAHAVPESIAADCSKPVEGELNAFLATVPNGATVTYRKNGCYGIDRSLEINDRKDLTLDGNGATFKTLTPRDDDPCRANWRIQSGSNITLKNMTVRGANTTGYDAPRPGAVAQCQHGYSFDSVQGGSLLNSKAFDTWGDPVAIGPDRRQNGDYCIVPPNRNILVDGFHGFNSGRTVGITNADGVVIRNSYFGDLYDSAIDLETDVGCESSRDVKLLNNRFGRFRFALVSYTGSEPPERSGNFEFSGNVTEAEPTSCYAPVFIRPLGVLDNPEAKWAEAFGPNNQRRGFVIRNNKLKTLSDGAWIYNVAGAVVEGNEFSKNYGSGCVNTNQAWAPNAYGVTLTLVSGAKVSGNTVVGGPNGGFTGEVFSDATSSGVNS